MGATNHMTGYGSAFFELDRNIKGTVEFGDGVMVQIEGMGTILFQCKNGEHHTFADVYFISNLTTNIVSVGQLDEGGFKIIIDRGVMVVRDSEGYLLAKV
jgi:transposase InsO family protein